MIVTVINHFFCLFISWPERSFVLLAAGCWPVDKRINRQSQILTKAKELTDAGVQTFQSVPRGQAECRKRWKISMVWTHVAGEIAIKRG